MTKMSKICGFFCIIEGLLSHYTTDRNFPFHLLILISYLLDKIQTNPKGHKKSVLKVKPLTDLTYVLLMP